MRLPDFPWDHLVPFKEKARSHPYGLVDLSVGTPVDATPQVVQHALAAAADSPGYPLTAGTPELGEAAAGWLARRLGVVVEPSAVLPVLGTKELVAHLPTQLGLEPGDRVWVPTPAYPTYEVGALLARCEPVLGPAEGVTLVWLNSPANPSGRVLSVEEMRAVVNWARERGVIVASDECYIELGWEARAVSVLHPDVCGGSHEGLLAVHSLSKRSNLAGYRAGFVTGDPDLVNGLLQLRKHAGMIMPGPVQAAMATALADDMHVADQRARYANRRAVLAAALAVAGFTIEHSEAGLYLWATRGEDCWATLDALSSVGILVAPGSFYGESGRRHVRVALTAPDAQIATVPERMTMLPPVGGQTAQHGSVATWAQAPAGYQQPSRPDAFAPGEASRAGHAAPSHQAPAHQTAHQALAHQAPSYPGQQFPGQEYPGQEYSGQEYSGQQHGGQRHAGHGGQPYPGGNTPPQHAGGQSPAGSFERYRGGQPEPGRPANPDPHGGRDPYGQQQPGQQQPGGSYRDGQQGGPGAPGHYPAQHGQGAPSPYGGQPPRPYETGQTPLPPYETGQIQLPPYETGQTPLPPYATGQLPVPDHAPGQPSPYETGQTALPRPYPPAPDERYVRGQGEGDPADQNGTRPWRAEPDIR